MLPLSRKSMETEGRLHRFFLSCSATLSVAVCTLLIGVPTFATAACSYSNLTELTLNNPGANPGALKAYYFVPAKLPAGAPLVVVLHGCGQRACDVDDELGWPDLAVKGNFALLFPEEQPVGLLGATGDALLGFKWWDDKLQIRGHREPASIMNMIDEMITRFSIDRNKVYITGLSAGGAMANLMLAEYPDRFAGGAPIAAVPYKCADGSKNVGLDECMGVPSPTLVERSGAYWGTLVRDALCGPQPLGPLILKGSAADCFSRKPSHQWPRVSIWQGANDNVVSPVNTDRIAKQWTNVHHLEATGVTEMVGTEPYVAKHVTYGDVGGKVQVETWTIGQKSDPPPDWTKHMAPVYPAAQCGCVSVDCTCEKGGDCSAANHLTYIQDAHICSSELILRFWGIGTSPTREMVSQNAGASEGPRR